MARHAATPQQADPAQELIKAAIVIGGIALGLMLLKRLTEEDDDEE